MKTLNLKDRVKAVKRAFKLLLDKDLQGLSFVWKTKYGTNQHTFFVDGEDPIDPIVETFIDVCSKTESEEQLNKFSANWLLRIAARYAVINGINLDDVKVMATPIRIGISEDEILKEQTTSYISNSFIDPTNKQVKEIYKILSCDDGKDPVVSLNEAMEFLRKHYPEKVKDLV